MVRVRESWICDSLHEKAFLGGGCAAGDEDLGNGLMLDVGRRWF